MTMLAPQGPLMTGSDGVRSRVERRAALDVSIDDELLRGVLRSAGLTSAQRRMLLTLVEGELMRAAPISERSLATTNPFGRLFGQSPQAVIEALVQMGLARRIGGAVRVRVAGCAVVMPKGDVPRGLLRALRAAELLEAAPRGIRL